MPRYDLWLLAAPAFLLAACVATAGAQQHDGSSSPKTKAQPYRDNEKLITEADGKTYVLTRWAIGSRDNIITLKVPREYVSIIGSFGPNYPDPNFREPYMGAIGFDAMLWDLQPVRRGQRLPREQSNLILHVLLDSIYAGSKIRNETEQLETIAKIRLAGVRQNYYVVHYGLQVTAKPDWLGLHRIGAVHTLGDKTPVGLSDFLFAGSTPESGSDFMLCTDRAVPDDPPPERFANPGCEHWFALPELSATVKVTYRRRHLDQWRAIKESVSELLGTWKP